MKIILLVFVLLGAYAAEIDTVLADAASGQQVTEKSQDKIMEELRKLQSETLLAKSDFEKIDDGKVLADKAEKYKNIASEFVAQLCLTLAISSQFIGNIESLRRINKFCNESIELIDAIDFQFGTTDKNIARNIALIHLLLKK